MSDTDFEREGCAFFPSLLSAAECEAAVAALPADGERTAGTRRLLAQPWCRELAAGLRSRPGLAALLPADAVAVQCTHFEKSATLNWLVATHQDVSIPVAERVEHPDLRGWSAKEGSLYVQPPAELLQQMVAVRLHLDDCGEDDGPLQVWPGSHRHGLLPENLVAGFRATLLPRICVAPRGSAWAMRPLLLHASSKARGPSRRRVLHFLFGPARLPLGLRWADPA